MDKKLIQEKIETYELFHNGLHNIGGAYVKVKNIKIMERSRLVIADITLVTDAESGASQQYNNCEYSFDDIGVK